MKNQFHECSILNKELLSIYNLIGNTPLECLFQDEKGGGIYAKQEWYNLFGTIKDRAAFWMIADALLPYSSIEEARDKAHILEYSGGSLGFSISNICKRLNLKNTLVLGSWIPESSLEIMRSLGSNLIICPKEKGFYEVIRRAKLVSQENPSWLFLYQHENKSCLKAHMNGTGSEILKQLNGKIPNHWIASIGTGATLSGVAKVLRAENHQLNIHAVTPLEQPYGTLEPPNGLLKIVGSGGLGYGLRQLFVETMQGNVRHWSVSYDDAVEESYCFSKDKNYMIGTSAAANYLIAKKIYQENGEGNVIVVVFPSLGSINEYKKLEEKMKLKWSADQN